MLIKFFFLDNHTAWDLEVTLLLGDQKIICVLSRKKRKEISVSKVVCLHSIKAQVLLDKANYIKNIKPNGDIPCAGKLIRFIAVNDKIAMKIDDLIVDENNDTDTTLSGSSDEEEIGKIVIR